MVVLLYKKQQRECANQQPESRWAWNQKRIAETLRQHVQQANRVLTQALKRGSQILIVVVPMQIWTFSPALHLHSCHPWVFPLKSHWITSSNLPPAAGKGEAEHSPPALELVHFHAAESVPRKSKNWSRERPRICGETQSTHGGLYLYPRTCFLERWHKLLYAVGCEIICLICELLEMRKSVIWGKVKNENQAGVTSALN